MSKSIEDLDNYLKQFNLRNGLVELGKFSTHLFNQGKSFDSFKIKMGMVTEKATVTQWNLAFLAYRLIMSSNDGRSKILKYKEVLLANSIQAQFDEALSTEKNIFKFFSRISQQQLWWQENQIKLFSRNHILLNELANDEKFANRINLDETFKNAYGLTIFDFMSIGWAIFGMCNKNPNFTQDNLLNHTVPSFKDILVKDKLNSFLSLMSVKYDMFRKSATEMNKTIKQGYEQYQFNPLFKYPIIETDARFQALYTIAPYIVPNIQILLRKLCDGLYWKLRDLFKGDDSREFLSLFGDIFELYVGKQLEKFPGKFKIHKLSEDAASQKGRKIADWLIIQNNTIIIIECKSQLFPQGLRETFDEEILRKWLIDNIVKGIEQLYSTEDMLMSRKLRGFNVAGKKVKKVIVTYEHIYHIESKLMKDKIKEYVKEKDLLHKYPKALEPFYIMHVSELELLENVLEKYTFEEIFRKKEELDKKESMAESNDFIAAYTDLDSEIDYGNTWLEKAQEEFFSIIIPSIDQKMEGMRLNRKLG